MPYQLILYAIYAILFVASVLLAPKPEFESARPKGLGDIQAPTASEARAIPILWGTAELRGANVLWYGDLYVDEITDRVSTGWFSSTSVTVGYRYYIGIHALLCYGPIDRFVWWEVNDKVLWEGSVSPTSDDGNTIYIDDWFFFGPRGEGGGYRGTLRIYGGHPTQNPSSYLIDNVSPDIPAYVDIAHIVWEQGTIGESERLGRWAFRASRFPDNLALDGSGHIIRGDADNGDANPAEVLYEILTDTVWGLSISPSEIDFDSFQTAGNTLATEQNGYSMLVDTITPAENVIKEVLRQIDGVLYEDSNGKFYLTLARADYVIDDLPIFDESNIIEVKNFSRGSWTQTLNHVNVSYEDRNKEFIKTGAFSQDLANVATQNRHVRGDMEFPGIKHATTANEIAARELRGLSFPFAKVTLTVNRDGQALRPGDTIRFYWDKLGLSNMVLRVGQIDQGEVLSGHVELECVQDIFQLAGTLYSDPVDSGWAAFTNTAIAFVDELVRQAPRIGLNQSPSEFSDPTLPRILSVAKKETSVIIGFEQWVDTGGGAGYEEGVGFANGTTPYAELDEDYPAATVDKEISDLLVIDEEQNFQQLSDDVAENIQLGRNIALIEGASEAEDEFIGWEQLVDNGDGTYTLRTVHRGLCDTMARDHSAGAKVWFVSSGRAVSVRPYGQTDTINVKHQSKTTTEHLDITSANALPITFAKRTQRPHHPANWTVNSTRLPVAIDETADLDFDWEHRLNTDMLLLDADDGSTGSQDTEVEYDIEFLHAVTQVSLRSETLDSSSPPPTGGTWLSYLYTAANLQTDTGEVGDFPLEARLQARYASGATENPPNLTSLQEITHDFNADIGGATVQSVDLDGATEYLANTGNLPMSINLAWTISVWVRGTSVAGGTPRSILLIKPTGNQNRIELILTDDSAAAPFNIRLWNTAGTLFKDYDFGSYSQNTWTMLTTTWDNTDLTVYQDGSAQTPTLNLDDSGTMGAYSRKVIVGVDSTLAAQWWVGHLFSPKIWDTDLGAAEITTIDAGASGFNSRANSGNYVSRDDLIHLWDFRKSTTLAMGQDYGHIASNLIDIMWNAPGTVTSADLDPTQVP